MSDFKSAIQDIKSRITCVDYARNNGLNIRRSGDRCTSPLRPGAKNASSFWVFTDHWYDWGGGNGGDVIDLAALLKHGGDKSKAIRELAALTGVNTNFRTENEDWVNYTQNLCNQIQYWHEQLTEEDYTYLHKRGITDETIARVKIGRTNNGRLSFPYWKNGYICYYATRHLPGGACSDKKYMKMPTDEFNEHTVWGLHSIENNPDRDTLIIAEGAFDALSFEQEGYPVISAITGIFAGHQIPTVLSIARMFNRVFIVYDNDEISHAGDKFTLNTAELLIENRIPCVVGTVPKPYKDISEYYADGGKLQYIIDNAKDGIAFLAENKTDIKELSDFAKGACRFMDAVQVEDFFENLMEHSTVKPSILKALYKECKKAPNDDFIANEILSRHRLLYNPKISFFEYNGKYWEKKANEAIENYIREELGPYATGQKLASVLRIIKAAVVTDQLFNNAGLNLVNGVIEPIEEEPYFIFREHSEADYFTYCLSYPYVPDAVSGDWLKFIETVTDADEKRMAFLQEYAAYVLCPDNRFQKAPTLVGDGANGKSVYLEAISNIFGKVNGSRIPITNLTKEFQLIHTLNKMYNISSENKAEFFGAEEVFKQLVSGDEVMACFKGKDHITFKPRCVPFIALNNMPKTGDKSNGVFRRLAFCEFPLKFVEVPKEPNERLIDRTLESKFAENSHLSGMLNWVLDGYVMICRCGYLTETREHADLLDIVKEESDPVVTYVKQLQLSGTYTNALLYSDYKYWCDVNNFKPINSRAFFMSAAKYFKEYRDDIEQFVSNGSRGYRPKVH